MRSSLFIVLLLAASGCASDPGASPALTPAESTAVAAPAVADPLAALQGVWQSTDDPATRVAFADGQFTESYDGEVMVDEPVRAVDACPGGPNGEGLHFQVGDDFCYAVVDVTPTALSYSLVGGRGNTLAFRRASPEAALAAPDGVDEPQGEGRDPDALFGVAVCEALRPAVLTGQTAGLERYAAPEVLAALTEDAKAGYLPDEEDIIAASDGDATCTISAGGDAWFELTLMGDGHVGQNAVAVARRTSYD